MSMNSSQTSGTLVVIPSTASTKSAPGTSMQLPSPIPTCGEFESQFKFILVTASITLDTAPLMKSLFRPKFSPRSVLTRNLLPRLLRTISKKCTESKSVTPKHGGERSVLSKSSTVRTKKLIILSPNTVRKFNVRIQKALSNSISTPRRIDLNVCSSALGPVQWALLLVALCLVLMERI